jgi:hypothetical protein
MGASYVRAMPSTAKNNPTMVNYFVIGKCRDRSIAKYLFIWASRAGICDALIELPALWRF